MAPPIKAAMFGSCLVRRPIKFAERTPTVLGYEDFGPIAAMHSFGEMVQTIEILRGQKTIPRELWHLCRVTPKFRGHISPSIFDKLDLALVEPSSPVDMMFRGHPVNRDAINQHVLTPIAKKGGKETVKLTTKWLRQGLMGLNEKSREEAADQLLNYIEGDGPNEEMARAVLRETRPVRGDLMAGFRKMQELLACPIGAVVYIFRFMPDGRPISWPAGFREDVITAAEALKLPMFEPTEMVIEFGVEEALGQDMRHYSEAFCPVVGEALLQFAEKIHADARAAA